MNKNDCWEIDQEMSLPKDSNKPMAVEKGLLIDGDVEVRGKITSYNPVTIQPDYWALGNLIKDVIVVGQLFESEVIQVDLGIINTSVGITDLESNTNLLLSQEALPVRIKVAGMLPKVVKGADGIWRSNTVAKIQVKDITLLDLVETNGQDRG